MDKEKISEVTLPSASQAEAKTILEQQNLIKKPEEVVGKRSSVEKDEKKGEEDEEVESESDNEEIVTLEPETVKKSDDVNLDDEFEKIVPFKFKRLSEESIDEDDNEIAEILSDAEPLEQVLNLQTEPVKDSEEIISEKDHADPEQKLSDIVESKTIKEEINEASINEPQPSETIIDEALVASDDQKPPVPIPTYLWEDVKKSKEQGGYPWTHLYKGPLGPDDEPEVILNYNHSPRSGRKASSETTGTPKSQKKVRIQDKIEVQETENYIQDLSDTETNDNDSNDENLDPEEGEEVEKASSEKKSPKGILKGSQKVEDEAVESPPSSSKFDSGSLKKKFKNPLQRIKKMADQQFKKVKSSRPFVKKIPVAKDEIVLNDEVKILNLKESPKSQHREIPAYVVKHQDSEDSVEIVDLDESPMESRKRRDNEANIVTPDEIIDLPAAEAKAEAPVEAERKSEQRESTVESHEISMSGSSVHSQREETPKKREHVYEDIEDYISKITSDSENVDIKPFYHEARLQRQDDIIDDPIFEEFSRERNKIIRKSLSLQDDSIKQELAKRIPKIENIEKQISDEDKEEKVEAAPAKQTYLLAPISSIDSTSSDEDRRQLSIVAEESEASDSNKKKSFDDSSVDRDVESLKNDGSDISTTLIEDEIKFLPKVPEEKIENESAKEEDEKIEVSNENDDGKVADVVVTPAVQVVVEEVTPVEPKSIEEEKHSEDGKPLAEAHQDSKDEASVKEDVAVKEDVVVKKDAESSASNKVSERWSKMRDHEYEPIGEPLQSDENINDLENLDSQKRKSSDFADGAEKKFLRTPTQDSEDNISAQDFQNEIESRFFQQGVEPIVDDEAHVVHQENTFEEAVIIDESPVKRDVPRKRNFMANAQEQSKSFHKKIKAQAGMFKTSINNKIKKKPKEIPVAVEIAQEREPSVEIEVPIESEAIETVNVQAAEPSSKKPFKMPNFTKNIKKPSMPTFKKMQIKKPEMPKISLPERPDLKMGERFSNLRKLGRSKSMKEESAATDSTSFTTPEIVTAEPVKKKFDFGTYPRMIRDKFKRPKLPERSDQSVRSATPPAMEFTQVSSSFLQRGPVASRWPEYDQESGKYQQFNSESDLDRESSIERRMRLDYERSTEEREDFEIVKRLMNEEQRQLDEMDRENQEIHLMAQQERFKKPTIERQESDAVSDEDKMLWSGMLNKDIPKEEDFDEPNALRFDDNFKFTLDQYNNQSDINRSYTPQTNQETQSSGSSGTRRRKGVFDDDDDYFLRESRISNELHIGDYISSAIKEGLSTPEDNALAHMGAFDQYEGDDKREFTPEVPTRSLKRKNKKNREEEEEENIEEVWKNEKQGGFNDFYKTFPPDRPIRKQKKSLCESEGLGEEIDLSEDHQDPDSYNHADDEFIDDINEQDLFYRQQVLKGLEHPDLIMDKEDYDQDIDYHVSNLPIPPTPPRRRKKKIRSLQPVVNLRNLGEKPALGERNIIVHRYEQKFVPLAQEEHFVTPTPTPRRTRSRSQVSAHTLDDADSFRNDSIEAFTVFNIHEDKENGYAQVRKELPSKPVRRKRSTKSLGDRQFATMPHLKRDDATPPPRPVRNYSTIGPNIPNKPPRRKSAGSLVEIPQTNKNDDDDYEEILDKNHDDNPVSQRLKSGEIVKRMKDRPLPPPPRPKRENKKHKKDDVDDDDHRFDHDDNAERIREPLSVETNDEQLTKLLENARLAVDSLPRQDSDFSESEKVVEVEVSTQTDPVLDEEFICDEDDEDIDIDEFLSSDGKMKTLEDILKEEQEAEMERARQLAEAENLSRGIQRFRDSSQRSMSERSRTSGNRSRSLSRPTTPSAVLVERKKSSPIIFEQLPSTLTEAGLFIHPITYDDYGLNISDDEHLDEAHVEPLRDNTDVNNNFETEHEAEGANISIEPQVETHDIGVSTSFDLDPAVVDDMVSKSVEDEVSDELDAEMKRKIEEMIESVMSSSKEELDWMDEPQVRFDVKFRQNDLEEEPVVESTIRFEISEPDEAPLPPPRRKSNVVETVESSENFIESQIDEIIETAEQIVASRQESAQKEEENVQQVRFAPDAVVVQPSVHYLEAEVAQETEDVTDSEMTRDETFNHIQDDSISAQFPSHLHLSSLEIDNLSVHSLQAGRIVASEIDSNTIVTNELECKTSNNLSNAKSIEFPPGFIEEIVERVQCAVRAEAQSSTQTEQSHKPNETSTIETQPPPSQEPEPPVRPPLPSQFGLSDFTSAVPPSFYQRRDFSEEEGAHQQLPHRRRKHQNKRKESTSEEDYQRDLERDHRSRNRAGTSNDQSVLSLGGQFARACGNALRESGGQLMEVLRASSKDENKRDLHIALIILIIIVAGMVLMGMGSDKSVHHHHWDFFNPPDNHGR